LFNFGNHRSIGKTKQFLGYLYARTNGCTCYIKGTVPRDFSPQLFFMKHIILGS